MHGNKPGAATTIHPQAFQCDGSPITIADASKRDAGIWENRLTAIKKMEQIRNSTISFDGGGLPMTGANNRILLKIKTLLQRHDTVVVIVGYGHGWIFDWLLGCEIRGFNFNYVNIRGKINLSQPWLIQYEDKPERIQLLNDLNRNNAMQIITKEPTFSVTAHDVYLPIIASATVIAAIGIIAAYLYSTWGISPE